jgi:hypothetical protein
MKLSELRKELERIKNTLAVANLNEDPIVKVRTCLPNVVSNIVGVGINIQVDNDVVEIFVD